MIAGNGLRSGHSVYLPGHKNAGNDALNNEEFKNEAAPNHKKYLNKKIGHFVSR